MIVSYASYVHVVSDVPPLGACGSLQRETVCGTRCLTTSDDDPEAAPTTVLARADRRCSRSPRARDLG